MFKASPLILSQTGQDKRLITAALDLKRFLVKCWFCERGLLFVYDLTPATKSVRLDSLLVVFQLIQIRTL